MRSRLVALGALLAISACGGGSETAAPRVTASPTPSRSLVAPTEGPTSMYAWSMRRVTASDLPHSWHPGCPVGPARLRLLRVLYIGFDGAPHTGELVVRSSVVPDVVKVFRSLYSQRFPIRSMRPVDEFGGSDDASMAVDNTSAFNCRQAVGGSGWSQHAFGLAIDVNPRENPYVYAGKVLPPEGASYLDRSNARRGMAVSGGALVRAFVSIGWGWGGRWKASKDYQHFSATGR